MSPAAAANPALGVLIFAIGGLAGAVSCLLFRKVRDWAWESHWLVYAVTGLLIVPLVEKYHDRIASLHLKDRKGPAPGQPAAEGGRGGGTNMPWGQGETPLAAVLQSMKKNKYRFPASIEYEYQTPEGSDVLAEIKKCVEYCRKALA